MSNRQKVLHEYRMLREIHGKNLSYSDAVRIISGTLLIIEDEVLEALVDIIQTGDHKREKTYGMVMGRFQPFHKGHEFIINEVLLDGKVPVLLLGDDNSNDTKRNPLSFEERKELIKLVYPDTEIEFLKISDNEDWTEWFNDIKDKTVVFSDITLYYNNKPQDLYSYFHVNGKEYWNEYYTEVFKDAGFSLKQVQFVQMPDIKIQANATDIRADLEAYKHLLDARVYWRLKEWKW